VNFKLRGVVDLKLGINTEPVRLSKPSFADCCREKTEVLRKTLGLWVARGCSANFVGIAMTPRISNRILQASRIMKRRHNAFEQCYCRIALEGYHV